MVDRLVAMTVAERLALPWLHPGRADVIGAGALILSRVLRRTPVDAWSSPRPTSSTGSPGRSWSLAWYRAAMSEAYSGLLCDAVAVVIVVKRRRS